MRVYTIGHGTRPAEELVATLAAAGAKTVVDVRRFPGSRRHPQFNQAPLAASLAQAGIGYRHVVELGGRLSGEPGEERFACIRTAAFRSYAARMGTEPWQHALAATLDLTAPCLMCAETLWWRCHRSLIAELLVARGVDVLHLVRPGEERPHRPGGDTESRDGKLYLCGQLVG
ncbi:MAG: DUF488 domain-containing protein [Actinobacteria bacterium]|nr:DUF488 domain-containing protein [Actinomycetota bacterium]